MKEGAQPVPFEPADAECRRLREENARLRKLLTEHNIPIPPAEPARPPAVKTVLPPEDKKERARKRIASVSEPFSRKRGRICATMGEPRWPVGIYTGGAEGLEGN